VRQDTQNTAEARKVPEVFAMDIIESDGCDGQMLPRPVAAVILSGTVRETVLLGTNYCITRRKERKNLACGAQTDGAGRKEKSVA
jgi:hypothetical protein